MQFGLVVDSLQHTPPVGGFDYVEADVAQLLQPERPDPDWSPPRLEIPIHSVHSLIPASLPITGPDANLSALRLHVQRACERAAQLGVRTITLSSPAALRFPDGFDPKQAKSQVLDFLRTAVPFFARYELMLVAGVNPPHESNVMTTLPEVLQYVWQVDHPWFQCLLDLGLVSSGLITTEQVKDALPWVRHIYVPIETAGLQEYFAELKRAKYADSISVTPATGSDPHQAVAQIREIWIQA